MSAEFVPFTAALNPPAVSARPSAAFAPVAGDAPPGQAAPAAARSASHDHAPKISLERDGDRVTRIRIECGCGQSIDLDCQY